MSENVAMVDVTVLLPVYNGERYLRDTIQSILTQTYRNYELLIVDDGSTDPLWTLLGRLPMIVSGY